MKLWRRITVTVFLLTAHLSGCNGNGGSDQQMLITANPVLTGTVLNNYNDVGPAQRGVADATVILVKAADAAAENSVSPVEDLADAVNAYPHTTTDSAGAYRFTIRDFSGAYPARGAYFVFVKPPPSSGTLLPGGSASRTSLTLGVAPIIGMDITLSDAPGADATNIGTVLCLVCHAGKSAIKKTLHFVGIRKIGPGGTVANGLMNMTNTSVYDLTANSDKMLALFTDPATRYSFADGTAGTFWLGKDATGYYFQLTADTNPKFYLKFTYGGETGLWRGLFMTTVYASTGGYAADHGPAGNDYAYFVFAPFQYNEDPNSLYGKDFVTYQADRWDFAGTGNNGFTADPETNSFDLGCATCHGAAGIETVNKGLPTERRVAVFPLDYDGYEIDGNLTPVNVGCEKCHGPGSDHFKAGGMGHGIISPDKLPAGRLTMICGTCHINGQNHTDIGGGAPLKADGSGNYEIFRPGMTPALFFGTADATGKRIAPFGTSEIMALTGNGYLASIDFETDAASSWMDMPYEATLNHSRASRQHYQDFVRSALYRNARELATCISCHDGHGSSHKHMLSYDADTNAACLPCHSGPGRTFPHIDDGMVHRLKRGTYSASDKEAMGEDVSAHMFDKTGSLQMAPYDPEGTAMGRCTGCHMPKTAKSADWRQALITQLGQYRQGDIRSHTFDVMATEAVNAMATARGVEDTTPAGISDACGSCHAFAGLY